MGGFEEQSNQGMYTNYPGQQSFTEDIYSNIGKPQFNPQFQQQNPYSNLNNQGQGSFGFGQQNQGGISGSVNYNNNYQGENQNIGQSQQNFNYQNQIGGKYTEPVNNTNFGGQNQSQYNLGIGQGQVNQNQNYGMQNAGEQYNLGIGQDLPNQNYGMKTQMVGNTKQSQFQGGEVNNNMNINYSQNNKGGYPNDFNDDFPTPKK